ncbi:hypothetical protein [Butyrivibrio sp. NC3005]|uniref:hypothetical protein n=1 Tax=Butyrivibrio sp. NC3005 TaxID=1280685 RepID=UPI00041C708B|nr:hypothetical protein [Butyrivibrio sp. NC3005]
MLKYTGKNNEQLKIKAKKLIISSDLFTKTESLYMTRKSLDKMSSNPLYTNRVVIDLSRMQNMYATLQKDEDERWRGVIRLYVDGGIEDEKIMLDEDDTDFTTYMVYGDKRVSTDVDGVVNTIEMNSGITADITDDAIDMVRKEKIDSYEALGACMVFVANFSKKDTMDVDNKCGNSLITELGFEHIGSASDLKKLMKDLVYEITGQEVEVIRV